MKETEIRSSSLEELIDAYSRSAIAHGRGTEEGDPDKANASFHVMAAVCRELRARGRDAQASLLNLLKSNEIYVRLWAASHCLEFSPKDAEKVLEGLSGGTSVVAFDAEMTLNEWRKGRLKFP